MTVQHKHHPHHPLHRHPRMAAHWPWLLPVMGGVLGLLVGGGVLLAIYGKWQADRLAVAPVAVAPRAFGPIAQVVTDLYQVNLTSDVTVVDTDPVFTPAPEQDIIVVSMLITNASPVTRSFLPSIHTYLRDDEGGVHMMHPTLSLTTPLPAADLKKGESTQGQLSFAVPKRLKKFRLYVDPAWGGMAPVVFAISRP